MIVSNSLLIYLFIYFILFFPPSSFKLEWKFEYTNVPWAGLRFQYSHYMDIPCHMWLNSNQVYRFIVLWGKILTFRHRGAFLSNLEQQANYLKNKQINKKHIYFQLNIRKSATTKRYITEEHRVNKYVEHLKISNRPTSRFLPQISHTQHPIYFLHSF